MKVLFRIPTRGTPSHYTCNRVEALRDERPEWDIKFHSNPYSVSVCRNEIFREAAESDADFLVMMDDDVIPTKGILDLPLVDQPVVAGLVPTWQGGYFLWNAMRLEGDHLVTLSDPPKGLEQVYAVGGAILCIRKDVLQDPAMRPAFGLHVDEWGTMQEAGGEDTYFSIQCQRNGYPIYVDPTVQGEHYRPIGLKQTIHAFRDNEDNEDFRTPTQFSVDVRRLKFDIPRQTELHAA